MIRHPWITYPSKDKDHISSSSEVNQKELEIQHSHIKSKCVFYRELKDFDDLKNDADDGESNDDDELLDTDAGFRKHSDDLERLPAKPDCLQDREFANRYIGYDEGISVTGLDSTSNWQFV